MVKYVKGNLLDSDCDYICHQVNCQGVMGSGIAKQIRERWSEVYDDYRSFCEGFEWPDYILGHVCLSPIENSTQQVANMFSQEKFGYDGHRYTSYDAFDECLRRLASYAEPGNKIGFPKNIGCGLGGGNWNVISALIEEIMGKDYEVYIYEYDEKIREN